MIEIATHRGNVEAFPENTLPAFESAYDLGVDMIELDLRMTADHEIVVIHDGDVGRTSNGQGIVSEMTLAQLKALDFGIKRGEAFANTKIPTFREFLELTKRDDKMQFNFEFKDYIHEKGEDFALESADRIIKLCEEYDLSDRMFVNSFDGELLIRIDEKYDHKYRLHGFYPYSIMRDTNASSRLYCACLFNVQNGVWQKDPISPREDFERVIADGIHPWIGAGAVTEEHILRGIEYGGELFTTNHPNQMIEILKKHNFR